MASLELPCRPRSFWPRLPTRQGLWMLGISRGPCYISRFRHNTKTLSQALLLTGVSELLTLRGHGPRRGDSLSNLGLIKDGALLVRDGLITVVGTRAEVEALPEARGAEKLDLGGRVALPGFVDSHTHLIHAASRAEEYELKIAGASYEEIART